MHYPVPISAMEGVVQEARSSCGQPRIPVAACAQFIEYRASPTIEAAFQPRDACCSFPRALPSLQGQQVPRGCIDHQNWRGIEPERVRARCPDALRCHSFPSAERRAFLYQCQHLPDTEGTRCILRRSALPPVSARTCYSNLLLDRYQALHVFVHTAAAPSCRALLSGGKHCIAQSVPVAFKQASTSCAAKNCLK